MTYKENITAILECYFTGFKKEIIDSACNRILEQESSCPFYKIDEDGHGLCKNHRYMEDVLGKIRAEIEGYKSSIDNAISEDELKIEGMKEAYSDCLEIIDIYMAGSEEI